MDALDIFVVFGQIAVKDLDNRGRALIDILSMVHVAGAALSNQAVTKIGDILRNPGDFEGDLVKVEGKIVSECMTGCWFNVKDDTGTLYIDLKGANLAIPQKVGHDVILEGMLAERSGVPMIKGTGVVIK